MIAEEGFMDKLLDLPLVTRKLIGDIIEDCLIDIGTHKYIQRFGLVVDDDPDYDSYYEVEIYHYREGDVIFSDINEISCDEYLDHYSKGTVIESYEQQQES